MVKLYSTGCPLCNVLKEKLDAANIEYTTISDKETMLAEGIDRIPILEADGVKMEMSAANRWINSRSK